MSKKFYTKNRLLKEQDNSEGSDTPVATELFCFFRSFSFRGEIYGRE